MPLLEVVMRQNRVCSVAAVARLAVQQIKACMRARVCSVGKAAETALHPVLMRSNGCLPFCHGRGMLQAACKLLNALCLWKPGS